MKSNLYRKKLVMIWPGVPPISSKAIYQRTLALSEHFDVYMIALNPVTEEIAGRLKKVIVCPFQNNMLNYIFFPLWAFFQAYRLQQKGLMDVIITSYPNWMLIVGIPFKKMGIPWIADLLDDPYLWLELHKNTPGFLGVMGNIYHRLLFKIIKKNLHAADGVICVGTGSLNIYRERYHINPACSIEVTNGANLAGIPKISVSLNISSHKPVLLYVGHIRRLRGADILIKTLSLLKEKGIECELRLVGPIDYHEQEWIDREIGKHNLKENICLLGAVPHQKVWEEIANATVCLYPFPSMPCLDHVSPIKVFEYMAMGKAVVASDLPGISGVIENGKSGVLVPHDDPAEFAKAIESIIQNKTYRHNLQESARRRVAEFEWKFINQKILNFINNILKNI